MDTRMSARELYERGRMLRQAKMYDRALADFRSVIQDPNYVGKAHTQAALCFRAMSRHGEAAAALEKALASSTLSLNEQMHVLYLLGQTLESLGRNAEALEAYGWVRQADSGFLDVDDRITIVIDPFFDRTTADELAHQDVLRLADAKRAIGRLILDRRVPPAVKMEDVIGCGQVPCPRP